VSGDNCDLLTPLLELFLCSSKTRDTYIAELMKRPDAHLFLFFGDCFAEHLSRCRQEWLHQCITSLQPSWHEDVDVIEFYHHTRRVQSLARIAHYSNGWRNCAYNPEATDAPSIMTCFWHPDTQKEFLERTKTANDMATLAVLPRLEYVDGVSVAAQLLDQHPRPQVGAASDPGGWTVIQASGTIGDNVFAEVERRFLELGQPLTKNAVEDREADQLLVNLGHTDRAFDALKVLGQYASKFKRAKDALVQSIPNLSPSQARRVMEEVCFAPQAGVSLQVAALKLMMDLQVPKPLQIYRVAWRGGACHRDVAANILTKLATSPVVDWMVEEAQEFFAYFDDSFQGSDAALKVPEGKRYPEEMYQAMSAMQPENKSYIGQNVLRELLNSSGSWSMPFLPSTVGSLGTTVVGCADYAIRTLATKTTGGLTTEVVEALTKITNVAFLASAVVQQGGKADNPNQQFLMELSRVGIGDKVMERLQQFPFFDCEKKVLEDFVKELLRQHSSSKKPGLPVILSVWVQMLKLEDINEGDWETSLEDMMEASLSYGGLDGLVELGRAVFKHVDSACQGSSSGPPGSQSDRLLHVRCAGKLFQQILDKLPAQLPDSAERDMARRKEESDLEGKRQDVLVSLWAPLVGRGCIDVDLQALTERCPPALKLNVTQTIVNVAVATAVPPKLPMPELIAKQSAQKALTWLADKPEDAIGVLSTLAKLWPSVLCDEQDFQQLGSVLELFAEARDVPRSVALVECLMECHKNKSCSHGLARQALLWLQTVSARDSVRLWAMLFEPKADEQRALADLRDLMRFCSLQQLDLPLLPSSCCSEVILTQLAHSNLVRAKVNAVSILREMDLKGKNQKQMYLVELLCKDANPIVAAAAKVLSASVAAVGK